MRPPRRRAHTKPHQSSPAASFWPTHMLAEKKVKPSITMNMLRLLLRPAASTGDVV